MTLQQLQYIVSLEKHKQFFIAAEECGVTQPTISAMIQKLEEELDIKLFDRSKQPIAPTPLGEKVITQARIILQQTEQLKELIIEEKSSLKGELQLGIIPTIAPYIVPNFIIEFKKKYKNIKLSIEEMKTSEMMHKLSTAKIDMGIVVTPLHQQDLLEIPLFYERFVAYVSPSDELYQKETLTAEELPLKNLWLLQEGHCFRTQVFNLCGNKDLCNTTYEAGSIDTLIKIIDQSGGYTIIPELHINNLSTQQLQNIRYIEPQGVREVSLIIRNDFIKERLLNAVAQIVKDIIPPNMVNKRLKKFAIKI